jgi:hypothetical protein
MGSGEMQNRCDRYCPDLVRVFGAPKPGKGRPGESCGARSEVTPSGVVIMLETALRLISTDIARSPDRVADQHYHSYLMAASGAIRV